MKIFFKAVIKIADISKISIDNTSVKFVNVLQAALIMMGQMINQGEFRFKLDEKAQWFSMEQSKY